MMCGSLAGITIVTVTNSITTTIIIQVSCPHHTSPSAGIFSKPREGTEADSPSAIKIKGCSRRTLPGGEALCLGDIKCQPPPPPTQAGDPLFTLYQHQSLEPSFYSSTSPLSCLLTFCFKVCLFVFPEKNMPSTSVALCSILLKSCKC